jgi:heme/copper-type cytochrome/quinol oxidase subunit 4
MLLFMVGGDYPTLVIILLIILGFGVMIFRFLRKIFRKMMKEASDRKINILSRVCAIVLAPILVIGSLVLSIVIYVEMTQGSEEDMITYHYEALDEMVEDLELGMSKSEVLELLGENDTTQAVMIYNLSVPEAKEKYILELSFNGKKLTKVQRQQ